MTSPQNFTLICTVTGFPLPSITWIKKSLHNNKSINIFSMEEMSGNTVYSIVNITNSQANDSGVYVCSAENIVNLAYDYSFVNVSGTKIIYQYFIYLFLQLNPLFPRIKIHILLHCIHQLPDYV